MSITLQNQSEVDRLFKDLTTQGLGDSDAISILYQKYGVGVSFLWKTISVVRGLDRSEAMKLVVKVAMKNGNEDRGGLNKMGIDENHCPKCGIRLFVACAGETTRAEIFEFMKQSKHYNNERDFKMGWIHPGRYCPQGCVEELWNMGSKDLFDQLEEERKKRETSRIIVHYRSPMLSSEVDPEIQTSS